MSFLTVEDINSVKLNYILEYYTLDTSKISMQLFNNVLYDFVIVSYKNDNYGKQYVFEIHNNLWAGGFYCLDKDGNYIDESDIYFQYSSMTNQLLISTGEGDNAGLKLILVLSNYADYWNEISGNPSYIDEKLISDNIITFTEKEHDKTTFEYCVEYLPTGELEEITADYNEGVIHNKLYGLLEKTNLDFNLLDNNLQVGVINHVRLNVNEDYLPNGDLVGTDYLNIEIEYDNNIIKAEYDLDINDYCFDLDLRDKYDNSNINLKVYVHEIDLVKSSNYEFNMSCSYPLANDFSELKLQLIKNSAVIELIDDIIFEENITISNDVHIIGNNFNIDLNTFNINIKNVKVKCEEINFKRGNACFIQEEDSKLILDKCKFENATITDKFKGSIIFSNNESSITELYNCKFINCYHTIYTGGDLLISKCELLYDQWNNKIDNDYPVCATCFKGNVDITDSVFDIDLDINYLCENELDIKFAQSLIAIGEDTIINGYVGGNLNVNDSLPLFNAPFNNLSHIFIKYYYPQISACVISSPAIGFEDKCACHNILGNDWVYKNNVQVTRVSWGSENTIRKINIVK